MQQSGRELGETAKVLANQHPWLTLGGAAVAGALAARALTPAPAPRSSPSTGMGQFFADILKSVAQNSIVATLAGNHAAPHAHNGEDAPPAP